MNKMGNRRRPAEARISGVLSFTAKQIATLITIVAGWSKCK